MNIKGFIRNNHIYILWKKIAFWIVGCFPIKSNKIIFDNFAGRGYGDDPKYIAEELRKNNPELKLIWVTANMNEVFPKGIKKVKYGTIRAAYHWSTSKVWIDNIKSSIKVKKKPEQYYIQTGHSTLGFKKNEMDANNLPEKYVRQAKADAKITDLMYTNNNFRLDKYKNRYWYNGEVLKCDVPRMSILMNCPDELKTKIYSNYHISTSKKIVLYAPTFRKNRDLETYRFDYQKCLRVLEQKFGGEFVMLIRLHPNEARYSYTIKTDDKNIINATNYPDMQELLAVSNVLITDYSGSMFDFGFSEKPVILLVKDIEKYLKTEREVYFNLSDIPFPLAKTENDLIYLIENFDMKDYLEKVKEFKKTIGYEEHGNGAKQISEIILSILK